MIDLPKEDKPIARDIIKRGILKRHAQWLGSMRRLLDAPLTDKQNDFDRSMQVTDRSRKFYKEAMELEDYYRNSYMLMGLAKLRHRDLITDEDLAPLSEDTRLKIDDLLSF